MIECESIHGYLLHDEDSGLVLLRNDIGYGEDSHVIEWHEVWVLVPVQEFHVPYVGPHLVVTNYLFTVFPKPFSSGQYLPSCPSLRVIGSALEKTIEGQSGF